MLQRTCEGALLRAVTRMGSACAQAGAECQFPNGHSEPIDHMDDESLAEMVLPHVGQRRLPWLIGPVVRRFPNNDVAGFTLMFGLPFLFGAIAGPLLLTFAIW